MTALYRRHDPHRVQIIVNVGDESGPILNAALNFSFEHDLRITL